MSDEPSMKMKPLEWREARVSDRWPRWSADSVFGSYEALHWSDGSFGGSIPAEDFDASNEEFSCDTLESAINICQADYASRIMALIQPDAALNQREPG